MILRIHRLVTPPLLVMHIPPSPPPPTPFTTDNYAIETQTWCPSWIIKALASWCVGNGVCIPSKFLFLRGFRLLFLLCGCFHLSSTPSVRDFGTATQHKNQSNTLYGYYVTHLQGWQPDDSETHTCMKSSWWNSRCRSLVTFFGFSIACWLLQTQLHGAKQDRATILKIPQGKTFIWMWLGFPLLMWLTILKPFIEFIECH